ncbi:MAG: xanthine dehydrogenase family protein molybdopterin-binding subunit [Hyphomicrobiales bacterium]|nr:xanthine dehydrogenase family protein molybdopterin-binding subunit [Hyphomicrobiales bacterium]
MNDGRFGSTTRLEDLALLTGRAQFVDDIRLPNTLHAAFVRSPHAHARITNIDKTDACTVPGVVAAWSIEDLAETITQERIPEAFPKPPPRSEVGPYVLARDEVCYVGEAVAVVIAESRYIAEDAAQRVIVDYDVLAAVADCRSSVRPGSPLADTRRESNLAARQTLGFGSPDAVFGSAPCVVKAELRQHRGVSHPMECRGVLVHTDRATGQVTMWNSTQAPHSHKTILVHLFGLEEPRVRVIVPAVGGGFGPKLNFYPEDAVVTAAAIRLGQPVIWIEDRREHFLSTTQERDQIWQVEMAADADGHILGLRGHLFHDQGAYTARGTNIPMSSATTILGPYVVPSYRMEIIVAHTNKPPATSMRGAGHPQGCFVMERLLDRVAKMLALDRATVRQRNMITAEAMPYTQPLKTPDGRTVVYDTGDYMRCQAELLSLMDYDGFPARQHAARTEGRLLGFGFANYVKPTGRGPFETGVVRIERSGRIIVCTGGAAMGQGFRTAMSQICATEFGVRPQDITVVAGDTDAIPYGFGGYASRLTVCSGASIHLAAREVRKKVLRVASHLMEVAEEDLDVINGNVVTKGVPDLSMSLAQIAHFASGRPGQTLPHDLDPGLEATVSFKPEAAVYANGAHGVELEVDTLTGSVKLLRYMVVHDSGTLINPMIVDGQVQGAVAHALGNTLFELMAYDADAQPLSTTLSEYLLITAPELCNVEVMHQHSPTDRNPLGVKGVGECGVMSVAPAVLSAIENALSDYGAQFDHYPITPPAIFAAIAQHGISAKAC